MADELKAVDEPSSHSTDPTGANGAAFDQAQAPSSLTNDSLISKMAPLAASAQSVLKDELNQGTHIGGMEHSSELSRQDADLPVAAAHSQSQKLHATTMPAVTFPAYQPALVKTSSTSLDEDAHSAHAPDIKRESFSSVRDSIPAFIPVVQVKRENTTAAEVAAAGVAAADAPPQASAVMTAPSIGGQDDLAEARGVKRPAPKSTAKKGVAKKGPPTKKQKIEDKSAKAKAVVRAKVKKATGTPLESSPAPHSIRATSSIARSSASPEADVSSEDEGLGDDDAASPDGDSELYCICRKPDTGTFMIGCDGGCDDWFHGKCVGIAEKDKGLIDRYMCPRCVAKGEKNGKEVVTTWKRMCRRPGCRMPARLAKKDEEPSKYCSDSCGVEFFREMMTRTRGATTASKKSTRKKTTTGDNEIDDGEHGPRGSVLSRSELKALVTSTVTFEEFKRLGDGVLSPPATPSPTAQKDANCSLRDKTYCNETESQRLAEIETSKDELRARHSVLKDQNKFINILRQTAGRIAESKNIKAKDLCGYDDRAQWDEAAFAAWRATSEGQKTLKSGILDIDTDNGTDAAMADGSADPCTKRKCAKHFDWSKLALETNRFETSENSEKMRALEREERDIKERAGLRARQIRAGEIGGTVEKLDLVSNDAENAEPTSGLGDAAVTPDVQDAEMVDAPVEGDMGDQETTDEVMTA